MPQTHDLKTWPEPFQAVLDGRKRFEYRENDRGYSVGDTLHLMEWRPDTGNFTGRDTRVLVTYLVGDGEYGIPVGFCVMGVDDCISRTQDAEDRPTYAVDPGLVRAFLKAAHDDPESRRLLGAIIGGAPLTEGAPCQT